MEELTKRLNAINWADVEINIHEKGYALVPGILSKDSCQDLIDLYDQADIYRKTVVMERYRFGLGAYKYFDYPLPSTVQYLREHLYPHLAPIANTWMKVLKIDKRFPQLYEELISQCHRSQQVKPTPLILKYGVGGFNTLHQDLYGEVYFPLQSVFFLNQPDVDYTGGEFVITQQTPRAQSKAIVLTPHQGDMLLFTTNFRPVKGKRGYYRANMKHGVSEVHSGNRHTLGVIFHDAMS